MPNVITLRKTSVRRRSTPATSKSKLPTDVSGLVRWYKADSLLLTDGSSVAAWPSSVGVDNFSASGSAIPTFRTNRSGSLPAIVFDNNDTSGSSTVSNHLSASGFCAIAAVKVTSTPTLGAVPNYANPSLFKDSGSYVGAVYHLASGQYHVSAYVWDGSAKYASSQFLLNAWQVWEFRLSSGTLKSSVNNGIRTSVSCGNLTSIAGAMGLNKGGSSVCDIGELCFYNTSVSDSDVTDVVAGLMTKWSV